MPEPIYIIKATGEREPFDPNKLNQSLSRAGADTKIATEIVSHITNELHDGMTTKEIYRHAFDLLKRRARPIAARYSLKKAVMELGPTGFPFEDFVAEIFRAKGFQAKTREVIEGSCVPHEIDVVAYNDNKFLTAEAKFHNHPGTKSDLKVALYVKARFDDLKEKDYDYGRKRKLDEMWIITNTKFTKTAIEYGMCNKLMMIGWSYPEKGNLHDMIEDVGLHPISALTSLSKGQRNDLTSRGFILCKHVTENPDSLRQAGLNSQKQDRVLAEIKQVCRV